MKITWQCALCLAAVISLRSVATADTTTQANVPVEIAFAAERDHADPFNELAVDVVFTQPDGKTLRVPAFWAGGRQWKARYASPLVGVHTWRTECKGKDGAEEPGLDGASGKIEVTKYTGDNPLFQHGPPKVADDHRHLAYADGTPFFWLGDTWWMGLSKRLHWPDEFQQLAADRKQKGFNVVQIVAGLYPDMPPFDPRGENEAGCPWEKDYARIRPEYFDAADRRLRHLVDQGISPCIVGAWGYFLPWLGPDKAKTHWRYLIARYGAWPVVWCAAGEGNLPYYLTKGFPYDDREQAKGWSAVMRYIRQTDPYHRLLTVHPTAINQYTARHVADDPALLDFDLLQTPHGQAEAAPVALKAIRDAYTATPMMPVIDGEASYEKLSDSLPTRWTRAMFWLCLTNGAAGHTYGANGIWQVNRRGDPHGKSPHGGTYGVISWDEAMRLPGSDQVAAGRKLIESLSWTKMTPAPDAVSWVSGAGPGAAPPQALTDGDRVTLVYGIEPRAVKLSKLRPGGKYRLTRFDPISGQKSTGGDVTADNTGAAQLDPPKSEEDWVALLEVRDPQAAYYEEDVSASNPLRVEQAKELEAYIESLKRDDSRLNALLKPDYSSTAAYEKSVQPLRAALCDSIGFPPPGDAPKQAPTLAKIGDDALADYYRCKIPVLPQVNAEGLYIVPKGLSGKAPLVISMHGGGGSPEVALFHGGANYHDMIRGGAKQGYIVFAPQHLFNVDGYPKDIRERIDNRLRLVGTSITAVEVAKISRSLDYLVKRPEVDAERIGMVGLSYGGFYTLMTAALEPRIKASVSSCYFGVQEGRYEKDELSVPGDFRIKDRFTLLKDTELVALVCPRALEIQAGETDAPSHREPGKLLVPRAESFYKNLGAADKFRHVIFKGGHEFHDQSAWEFLKKNL